MSIAELRSLIHEATEGKLLVGDTGGCRDEARKTRKRTAVTINEGSKCECKPRQHKVADPYDQQR